MEQNLDQKNLIKTSGILTPKNIVKEMNESFIEYAMSVIVSRALPDVRDGLKPVHRRIIHSMNESGFDWAKPHKKAARIVGEVLGKYHPHGDTAVYDSLVRLAQDFSMRYPLIDGHGNFGSLDGDSAAAMRYTEARLARISSLLIEDINKKTVTFVDNYDASEKEPTVLPAKFPNLLANGSVGIAVGMATSIPPHNISELIDGLILLAKNPDVAIIDLIEKITGPDFPTGGIISGDVGIINAYETGRGSIQVRAKGKIEIGDNDRKRLVYTEIPYMINKAELIHKIATLVKDKQIEGISTIRDESNRDGIRIVIELKNDFIPEVVQNQLFKLTSLQSSFSINILALVNNEPKTLNLKEVLQHYLNFQVEIFVKKTKFELAKSEARIEILIGIKIAVNNIDDVIEIIKKSSGEQNAQDTLRVRFSLSENQAKAIIDMRLGRLTSLAQEKLENEINELETNIKKLNLILLDEKALINEIVESFEKVKEIYGDSRKTLIEKGDFSKIQDEDLIPKKEIVITLTRNGYAKRFLLAEYNIQKRGGMGSKKGSIYEDDETENILITNTHANLLIFTSLGRVYRIRAYKIPPTSRIAKGTPFINLIDISKNEKVITILPLIGDVDLDDYLLTATTNGIVKKTSLSEYEKINKNGKKALLLKENDKLLNAILIKGSDEIILGSSKGRVVRFSADKIRATGRVSSGVIGMKLDELSNSDQVVGICRINPERKILSVGSFGFGKITPVNEYRVTNRGAKGVISIDTKKAGKLICIASVNGDEEAVLLTTKGIGIRLDLKTVRETTARNAKGVTLINLNNDDSEKRNKITSVAIIDTSKIESEANRAQLETQQLTMEQMVTQEINIAKIEKNSENNISVHENKKPLNSDSDE